MEVKQIKVKENPSWRERKTSVFCVFSVFFKSSETNFCAAQDVHNCIISSQK